MHTCILIGYIHSLLVDFLCSNREECEIQIRLQIYCRLIQYVVGLEICNVSVCLSDGEVRQSTGSLLVSPIRIKNFRQTQQSQGYQLRACSI